MNDFGPRGYDVMDGLFRHLPKRCILDGELLVWNKLREQWYPFGALTNLINAANLRKSRDELFPLMTHLDDRDGMVTMVRLTQEVPSMRGTPKMSRNSRTVILSWCTYRSTSFTSATKAFVI